MWSSDLGLGHLGPVSDVEGACQEPLCLEPCAKCRVAKDSGGPVTFREGVMPMIRPARRGCPRPPLDRAERGGEVPLKVHEQGPPA